MTDGEQQRLDSTETAPRRSVQRRVRRYYVYVLLESGKHVRYIGITSQKPERRLLQHYSDASRKRTDHKTNWIRNCLAEGIPIEIRPIKKELSKDKAERLEIGLIRFFGKAFRLVNSHDGGSLGYAGLSPESKSKHSQSGKSRYNNPAELKRARKHMFLMSKKSVEAKERKRMQIGESEFSQEMRWKEAKD